MLPNERLGLRALQPPAVVGDLRYLIRTLSGLEATCLWVYLTAESENQLCDLGCLQGGRGLVYS